MNPKHRKATFDDSERLCQLRRQSILELAPRGMALAEAELWANKMTVESMEQKIRESEVWIAEMNDTIVGWVAVRGDYLDGLYVGPQFERRGIGSELLSWAEELARRSGVQVLRADASSNAEEFYFRRGYEPAGPRPPDGARPIVKRMHI